MLRPTEVDIYPAANARPGSPGFLVLPGGAYQVHSAKESEPIALWLSSIGLHAFVLRYPVAPHRHPASLEAAVEAMKWIRSGDHGLDIDPRRVGTIGFSAGGHLAAMLCATDPASRPDRCVLAYPVISFLHDVNAGSIVNLLGAGASEEAHRAYSMEERITRQHPPTFIWHTADDASVAVTHSYRYARALAERSVPCDLHVFAHGPHGLGLASQEEHDLDASEWPHLCEGWLARAHWL